MINIGNILKRSWHILWNYRVLWIFGILAVLTGAGGAGGNNLQYTFGGNRGNTGTNNYNPNFQPGPFLTQLTNWFNQNIRPLFEHPDQHMATFIWIGVAFLLFILIVGVVTAFIRYVSETAVIRMVDEYEQTGAKVVFKQGWKMGWNRRAFRMWVIDLVVNLPVLVFMALLILLGLLVYFSVTSGANVLAVGGTITAIGCAFLFVFALVILMVFLSLLRQFFIRQAALEEASIGESFRAGWALFKSNWKSAGLMWLVMLGISFGFGILTIPVFFLLNPLYLILAIPGIIVAAIPAAIAFGLTALFGGGPIAWIVAALVAAPFLLLVAFTPLTIISAWFHIYSSNVWTLTYREIKALDLVKPEMTPAVKS
jgi:hypothetical protein